MKDSLWKGIGISIGIEILYFFVAMFVASFFPYINVFIIISNVLSVIVFLTLFIWGIVLIVKKEKVKFGIGLIIGLFIPALVIGACILTMVNTI